MNYENYKCKVVEAYGVTLVGWPTTTVRNPGTLGGRDRVMSLLELLQSGTCHWVQLSSEELEERISNNKRRAAAGEAVYKERRNRKSKSAAKVDDDKVVDEVDDEVD